MKAMSQDSNGRRLLGLLSQSEVLPALVVLSAVAILILPVSAAAVDLLLSINFAFAVTMLLLAIRVGGALKVSAFPTMLLVSTLFRLSLNVSTTRLILSDGDAGAVVRAFGSFVTAGNPLVGGVLFLILTMVQFIVIAKGAERVAEVTARFTLDAMPGKQMSIDADLRAGLIDQDKARARRSEIEREAQFHGSMDGAMKFVKGDALAGMAITLVNLLGGLLVGCVQRGLSVSEAISTYTVLTIGDGLVSQIPALLISVAAGLVVTRVRAERPDHGLGRQVASQVAAHPEVLLFGGVALVGIGLAPGMPLLAFGFLGACLSGLGGWLTFRQYTGADAGRTGGVDPSVCALVLRLPAGTVDEEGVRPVLQGLQDDLLDDLGVGLPPIETVADGLEDRWSLLIDDVPVVSGAGTDGWMDPLRDALRRLAARFVGVQETQDMLDRLERVQPALVREVVPRLVPPVLLSEILTRLVEEQVPVRNLRGILTCLAEWARSEADPMMLAERVREHQRAIISHRVAPDGNLEALLLDPAVERLIQESLDGSSGGTSLTLSPEDGQAIIAGLERALARSGRSDPVVVCRPGIRRPFWKLVSAVTQTVRVVSFLELEPSLSVQPIGRIELVRLQTNGGLR